MKQPVNIRKALRSFQFAGFGIFSLFRHENNARIHLIAALLVVAMSILLRLSSLEWCLVVIQVGLVWAAEAFNTSIEKLADVVSPEYHPTIKVVKDLAAAGVLILSLSAVIIGGIIFIPKLLALV